MTDATISIRDVHKTYVDEYGNPLVEALRDINLEIAENDFIAFLGPSGCGKTTLLRLIAGIEEPTRGSLSYRGRDILKINTDVGYVPQGQGLFPWMTLRENIDLPLRIKKIDPEIRRSRIEEWLEKVGLTGFEDSYPWQLSGGMEKRGALVRALISHCEVNLMDEPFGPVDAQTKLVLQNDLLSLWSQIKSIVVFVTHDLLEAVTLSDKIVIFSKRPGQIKTVIPVDIPRPRNVYEIFRAERFNEIYDEVRAALRDEITLEG